jgi:hypothetical protein
MTIGGQLVSGKLYFFVAKYAPTGIFTKGFATLNPFYLSVDIVLHVFPA